MTTTDPRWAEVRGASGPAPDHWEEGHRVTVEVRVDGDTIGATHFLHLNHTPADYARALRKIVRAIDQKIEASTGQL